MIRRRMFRVGIGSLVVVIMTAVSFYRVPTTFSITATTQIAELMTTSNHRSPWYFENATIYLGNDPEGRPFTGSLLVRPETRVTFERIGTGPLLLLGQSLEKGATFATLDEAEGGRSVVVKDRLVVVMNRPAGGNVGSEHMTVLPMSGRMSVGAEVRNDLGDQSALLLDGKVTLLAHTFIGERRYDAGEATLELGDYPQIDQLGDAYGLLVFGQEPDLMVSFRVIAKSLRITRFGSLGYEVYASPMNRIKNDHALQAMWVASLFFLAWIAKWGSVAKEGTKKK